eukprot:3302453-Rhodomonas_salina.1
MQLFEFAGHWQDAGTARFGSASFASSPRLTITAITIFKFITILYQHHPRDDDHHRRGITIVTTAAVPQLSSSSPASLWQKQSQQGAIPCRTLCLSGGSAKPRSQTPTRSPHFSRA